MEKTNLVKVKIFVSQVSKKNLEEGKTETFTAYKAMTKQGKIDLRFTKDVAEKDRPTKSCYIFVPEENVNVNQKYEFPVMWVSKIDHTEDIEFKQNLKDYLD